MPNCSESPRSSAVPRDAQFVVVSLVSSGTTRGEHLFVPRSASMGSELAGKATAIGWAGSRSPFNQLPENRGRAS